jgi:hypothetical protein
VPTAEDFLYNQKMSLVVVGSVAYDGVETPHGRVDRMLGGAADIALAASYFTQPHWAWLATILPMRIPTAGHRASIWRAWSAFPARPSFGPASIPTI